MPTDSTVAPRFRRGYEAVASLERYPRYLGAVIFGSVAEGTTDHNSDLDVRVAVDEDNPCQNINHPMIDDYKLDLTFASLAQMRRQIEEEMESAWNRSPNLATALIVFDKTGELRKLKEYACQAQPRSYRAEDHQFVQFALYHADNKVSRCLEDDPLSSLYSMHANIGEVLKIHYRLSGRWWVSSKRVLGDLERWDIPLAKLLRKFVSTADAREKHALWTRIIDHVLLPLGGRKPISENNCDCENCRTDLQNLMEGVS